MLAERRGASRFSGRAPARPYALLGSFCPERASRLRSLPLRPSVGAWGCGRALRCALGSGLSPQPPSARPGLF